MTKAVNIKKPKKPNPVCEASHAKDIPTTYLQYALWAEKMEKTHKNVRCQGCGHFSVWVKK